MADDIIVHYLANGWYERNGWCGPKGSKGLNCPLSCRSCYCVLCHSAISFSCLGPIGPSAASWLITKCTHRAHAAI